MAAYRGHTDVCALLLDRGASVSAGNSDGLTPLHIAVIGGQVAACALLLDRGAVPDARGTDGATPLH
ncbi:ankyrin repeat domain-containing protein, partial [Streptomyces caeruleatus]